MLDFRRPPPALPVLLPVLLAGLLLAALPAFASDFYTPSPVPSSRNSPKAGAAKTKRAPVSWQNLQTSNKIVKSTKPAGSAATQTATDAATAQ